MEKREEEANDRDVPLTNATVQPRSRTAETMSWIAKATNRIVRMQPLCAKRTRFGAREASARAGRQRDDASLNAPACGDYPDGRGRWGAIPAGSRCTQMK